MSVKTTVTDNTSLIKLTMGQRANIFLRKMADRIVARSTPKTPKRSNRLRLDVIKQVVGKNAKIIWGKNYAIYQEEKQFKHYTTPGTGPHFAENAVRDEVKNSAEIAKISGLI